MDTTLPRKWTKSRTRARKLHLTEAKARVGRARKTRADLERQLKACKREIANARERLIEATKQQTATSEMLRIISDSPLQSVLDAVAEHAARLCDSNHAEIYRLENNLLRLVAAYGDFPVHSQAREGFPVNRDRVIGRTICDRRSVHVHDLAAEDSEYPLGSSDAKRLGHRTTLGTPLLRERTPIGGILFRRFEVRPFSDNQIALLESFAGQAAIVIENVRLFEAEKQRTLALAQANRDLAEREARIRRLVDANIIGIVIWNLDGEINDANDAFLRMVGYDREDLLAGRIRWTDLTSPELRERNEQTLEELNRAGTTHPFEKEYFRKDGSRVPVLIGRAIFEEGGNRGVAFVLDLTEQKRAEAALRESEEQWKAVFENNPIMYFMVDEAGTIMSVNPFGAEQLGYRVEELIGRPVQSVFYEADRDAVYRNACICFRQPGEAMSWELRKVRKNGEMIWVRETARATSIRNRLVLLIVCEDITEGKRATEVLREVQTELVHANRVAALGQLTASIAHEVNQPIAAARNNAGAALHFLDSKPPDLEEIREALFCVVNDTERAGGVISRIRTLVKKAPPRTEYLDLNEAIRDVIVITRGEAAKNGISVETQLAEPLPPILGDRVQLQQVILNLIINAIEAMGEVAGPRQLLIKTARSESDGVSVAVQDTGPGLATETLSSAFEAFYTTKPDGLGIGLAICRSIVEAHGGRLWGSANLPRGAIFQFTVPLRGDG